MGLKGRWGRVLIAFVASASIVLATTPTASASIRNSNEAEVFKRINDKRVARGKVVLKKHLFILDQVRAHSKDMAARLTMDHNGVDGRRAAIHANDAGIAASSICENVAYTAWTPPTARADSSAAQTLYNLWLNSPPHKKCMLDADRNTNAAAVGLAKRSVVKSGRTWTYWFATFMTGLDTTP